MEGLDQLKILVNKLKRLPEYILKSSDTFMTEQSNKLADLNRENLMNGIDNEGHDLAFRGARKSILDGAYTKSYARKRQAYGAQTSHVDLRLLGGFHTSIVLKKLAEGHFKFDSEIDIYPYLVLNYGPNLLGITEEQMKRIAENDMKPYLENKLIAQIAN